MRKMLVITDVTHMNRGCVCVAGYDQEGHCVRPVLPPPGILEEMLCVQKRPVIFPFAKVEFDLQHPTPDPPHTEDCRYDPKSVRFVGQVSEEEKKSILQASLFPSLQGLFDVPICTGPGYYVMEGQGPRSLGTVQPRRVLGTVYEQSEEGTWKYRLGFVDGEDAAFWLTVTDLTWRYYLDFGRQRGFESGEIAKKLTRALQNSEVYLRIGLARGWEKFPDRCYIQIVGIHTFPDFLKGRTFVDFVSAPSTTPGDATP